MFALFIEVVARHAHCALVPENEVFECARAVPRDDWESLFGNGEYSALLLRRTAIVKHPELESRNVLLNDRINNRAAEKILQFYLRPDHSHPRSALAHIGLQDYGKTQ